MGNIRLLGVGNISTPFGLRVLHHLVGDLALGLILQAINPAVANAITELLLLAPEDVVGQVGRVSRLIGGVKGLAQHVLLDTLGGDHLVLGVNTHGGLKEFLVEERNTGLKTPCGGGLVGTEAVSQVQVLDTADSLLVELLLVRSSVEVKVATEDLVGTLTTQNHLDTHGLDLTGEQVHGSRGTNGGHIVGLEVVDHVREGIEAVLNSEGEGVVLGAEELGNLKGSRGIGGTGKTDGE